jgi:hypothetical protein
MQRGCMECAIRLEGSRKAFRRAVWDTIVLFCLLVSRHIRFRDDAPVYESSALRDLYYMCFPSSSHFATTNNNMYAVGLGAFFLLQVGWTIKRWNDGHGRLPGHYAQSLRKYTPPPSLAQTREIILSVTGRSLLGGTASVTICAANLQTSTVPHFPQCTFCLLSHCLKYNRDVSSLFVGVNAPDLIAPRITRVQNSRSESG